MVLATPGRELTADNVLTADIGTEGITNASKHRTAANKCCSGDVLLPCLGHLILFAGLKQHSLSHRDGDAGDVC
jgi:hypothetical protein